GVLIDPLVPEEAGIEWFSSRPQQPRAVVLSNRHHLRHAPRFREAFGCRILCNRLGLYEFSEGEPVDGFDPGETLPGPLVAHELGGICSDDTALYLREAASLAFADGVVRGGECAIGFVPDSLMDDPPQTKRT